MVPHDPNIVQISLHEAYRLTLITARIWSSIYVFQDFPGCEHQKGLYVLFNPEVNLCPAKVFIIIHFF